MTLFLGLVITILIAVGQLLLKIGADAGKAAGMINRFVLAGYAVFLLTVVASFFLMQITELKNFTVLMSLGYISVTLAASLVLKEKLTKRRLLGTAVIAVGICIFLMN